MSHAIEFLLRATEPLFTNVGRCQHQQGQSRRLGHGRIRIGTRTVAGGLAEVGAAAGIVVLADAGRVIIGQRGAAAEIVASHTV